ncbi:Pycsar system effector family protein [Streptomyces naphthomycinicus]|uniref:Pycsar system effector family protein n=1 Tax=Streptomyces naphthomycinicus TaxID=2872625 RepID=UPI001CECC1B3|nr:Pycsar system effector family protein [Streptomyces sp. TML10]
MTAAPSDWDSPQVQAGVRLLADVRAEISRADAKAAVLVGVLGLTSGVLAVTPAARGHRTPPPAAAPLWWAGAGCLIVSLFALLLAVVPRHGSTRWEPGRPLTYFGDVRRAVRTGELTAALTATGRDPLGALLLALTESSRITARKNAWIRTGLIAFAGAAVLLPCSLLLA